MKSYLPILITSLVATTASSNACDICGCYTPPPGDVSHGPLGLHVGVAEQFTWFGSLRTEGHEVSDPADQYLASSITQIVFGKSFLDHRLVLQANVPLIYRDYRRAEGFGIDEGSESGLGDISLIARYEIYRRDPSPAFCPLDGAKSALPAPSDDLGVSVNVFGGVKLPTGDSSRLKEEFDEVEIEDAPPSGVHGHDLALGSGSVDAIFGGDFFIRQGDWFFAGKLQYAIRGEGDYHYRYANDLTWNCGPGWYALRETGRSLALQCVLSGETKDTDRFDGETADDTGLTAVYLGPQIIASLGAFSGELGLDLPIRLDNTALQIVPDYRIRAAFVWRF